MVEASDILNLDVHQILRTSQFGWCFHVGLQLYFNAIHNFVCSVPEVCKRPPWYSTMLLGKRLKLNCSQQYECKQGTTNQHENIIQTVKFGGRSIMIRGSHLWSWTACHRRGENEVYQGFQQDNVRVAVHKMTLNIYHRKSTTKWLWRPKICLLEWPNQSPGPQSNRDAVEWEESYSHQTS